jgi:rhodanese-related sulfurtransferase
MEWYHYVIIGVVALFIIFFVISFVQAKKASSILNAEEFKNNMRKGQLIDVRTKDEYNTGHINGARSMYMGTISREYRKLRHDQPVYIYCSNGKRSQRAAVYLLTKGYNQIYTLDKGLKSWTDPLKESK